MKRWLILLATVGCNNGSTAGLDASNDALQPSDSGDAMADAKEASAPCKIGLLDAGTPEVTCMGSTPCPTSEACCISNTVMCKSQCGNLETDWQCERSAHCGTGQTCCYDLLFPDFTQCPGAAALTQPTCVASSSPCDGVVCQTDADCEAGTCYAVALDFGAEAGTRTLGICR